MKKVKYDVKEHTMVDPETGELTTMETTKRYKVTFDADKFYMTFIDYMAPFYQLKNGTSKSILALLCELAQFNTGNVSLSTADRSKICERLNIKSNVLSNCLKELTTKKLLYGEKGSYTINPQIFWKGDIKSRYELLERKEIQLMFSLKPINEVEVKEESDFKSIDIPNEFAIE